MNRYSSSQSIAGSAKISSSSKGSLPRSKRKPADYTDYLSSGKIQESFLEALKEPVLRGTKKEEEKIVILLKKGDERLFTFPNTLDKRYFDTEVNFPVIDNKDLKYFQSILIETGSVAFNHMNQNKHTGDISFSKAFIRKVIHITEWGLNPNKPMQLNFSHKPYNYWDYISAWKHAFYYQNRAGKHTWFIRLEPFGGKSDQKK